VQKQDAHSKAVFTQAATISVTCHRRGQRE
jgi:hypothetical protein